MYNWRESIAQEWDQVAVEDTGPQAPKHFVHYLSAYVVTI